MLGEALAYYEGLLGANRRYAGEKVGQDPEYFTRMSKRQTPKVLWIGCSDSRVASDIITMSNPGSMFAHRNIGNLVIHTDMSVLSAIEYAVRLLSVDHIIVCGHYGCGGIQAALASQSQGLLDNWLRNIRDVYRLYHKELDAIDDAEARARRLVELNVIEQVYNVCKTSVVQKAWVARKLPYVHGWVYDLENGLIKDLQVDIHQDSDIVKYYTYDVDTSLGNP